MHIWCLKVGALTGRGLGSTTLVCLVRINKEWPLFTGPTHLFSVQVSFHPSSTFPFNPQRKLCGSRAVSHEKDNTCIDVVTNDGATNIAESTKAIIRSQSRLHRCDSRLWEMNIGPNTKRRNKSIRRNQKTKNCFEKKNGKRLVDPTHATAFLCIWPLFERLSTCNKQSALRQGRSDKTTVYEHAGR